MSDIKQSKTTSYLTNIEKLRLSIINAKRNDLNNLFQRELTKTEYKYLQAEILKQIDRFILTYTIEKAPNSKVYKYAYYSNVPERDRAIIHNFLSSILKVAHLQGQRDLDVYGLKNFYTVGKAIVNLRSGGFPTKQQKFLVNDLKSIYDTIYTWFERDFGTRDPAMINYGKLSRKAYNKYY